MSHLPKPPKFAEWLIRALLAEKPYLEELLAQIDEEFAFKCQRYGPSQAHAFYMSTLLNVIKIALSSLSFWLLPYRMLFQFSVRLATALAKHMKGVAKTDPAQEPPEAPIVGRFLLKALVPRDRRKEAYGDAVGEFPLNWKEFGKWGARALFWEQVIVECCPTLGRWFRWFFWGFLIPHLSEIWHKFVS